MSHVLSLKERLSKALVSKRLLTADQLAVVLQEAGAGSRHFARLLIDRGLVTEEQLNELLAQDFGIPMISLATHQVSADVSRLIPKRIARQYTAIPVALSGDRLQVAIADPLNIFTIEDLSMLTRYAVDPVLAPASEIRRAIERIYGGHGTGTEESAADPQAIEVAASGMPQSVDALLREEGGEAPVVRAINLMISEALRQRASDIHLEPMADGCRLRYRIDGRLREAYQFPKRVQSTMLTRLKIMSGMDITESRLPQDGRFKIRQELGGEVDFRVSVLPVADGNKVVMRILNRDALSIGLSHLGFLPDSIRSFKAATERPHGMILVTGPTGSGKSTTLYSILNQLNDPTRNLVTIEDPVEYQLPRVTQVQVNPDIGLTFGAGLRSLLRQSPDIIMIGEIRDFETADIAMKASLTGQLVLSTLHTNDAASAVTRLVDMGVEPFLVASSVTLIEAQRLVRTLCTSCREPADPSKALVQQLGLTTDRSATFYRPKGCHSCQQTGYRGRMGIIEVFPVDEHVQELIVSRANAGEIRTYAIESLGLNTLRQDGLRKAAMGLTTIDEILQATSEE